MKNCLFCKIANKETPADIVYEDRELIAFKDIHPKAVFHILIIPKRHISSINTLKVGDSGLMGKLILSAKKIAEQQGFAQKGYKLIFNIGRGGGQVIEHLHVHLLSGKLKALP